MEYVLKILEEGSISAAAKKLYVSQPLLSQKLKQIELDLGITVFDRNTVPISLTPAGRYFVSAAEDVLKTMRDMRRAIDETNDAVRGTLRLAISHHRAVQLLPELFSQYVRQYPLVTINVMEHLKGRFSDAVLAGRVDMAFVRNKNISNDLELEVLSQDKMLLIGGNETKIAQKIPVGSTVTLDDIALDTFVSTVEEHGFREDQDAIFAYLLRRGLKPKIALETTTFELACRLAISCNYIALMPETFQHGIQPEVKKAFWCYLTLPNIWGVTPQFCLCYRKNMFLPKYMRDFIVLSRQLYHVN
jgi:DNA-binding transcriptional LysR family regulator